MSISNSILNFLKYRYAEKHRFYHSWSHIEFLLHYAQKMGLDERDDFLIALLFHDVVYDPQAVDNEHKSAELMRELLKPHVSKDTIDRAEILILATRDHSVPEGLPADLTQLCGLFLDMDLVILAAEPDVFETYNKAIRREYGHVPEPEFRRGRAAILRGLVERDRIYVSEAFSSLEFTARHNLEGYLQKIEN